MGKEKAANLEVSKKAILRYGKALGLAVLVLAAVPLLAQSPVMETLGVGAATTTCGQSNWPCMAPVIASDGSPDGSIAIYNGSQTLMRYGVDGSLIWASTDYDGTNFTHNGLPGTLTYTLGSKEACTGGGGGRGGGYRHCSAYKWVSGGSLTE